MALFKRRDRGPANSESDQVTAFPIKFSGPAPYAKPLGGEFGVVFEDDGATGYFYATDGSNTEILDALHVYDCQTTDALQAGDQVFVVWNPARRRAGLFYRERFQAVFDFAAKRGVCRTGAPPVSASSSWSAPGHDWDEAFIGGLEP